MAATRPISDEAMDALVKHSGGDARRALNALEMAALTAPVQSDGRVIVDLEHVRESVQGRQVLYDTRR